MRLALALLAICGCRQLFGLDDPSVLAVDAALDDAPAQIVPMGTHYRYVVNHVAIPTTTDQSRAYGLDLDGNGTPDNNLGQLLGTFSSMGFGVQQLNDIAVLDGSMIELVDLQSSDPTFTTDSATGLTILTGKTPVPSPCTTGEVVTCTGASPAVCTGCGHHLIPSGGSFGVGDDAPPLVGTVSASVFEGGPGTAHIAIALFSTPIGLDLIGARVAASTIDVTSIGSLVIGGALPMSAVTAQLIPGIQTGLAAIVARDCSDATAPPGCGCPDGSEGNSLIDLYDTNHDCQVSIAEVGSNNLLTSLLSPDVTIDGVKGLSVGIKVTAERATF
jgi:hypothetical protein